MSPPGGPTTQTVKIAPSILAADMGKLAAEIADVESAGADWIHVDVMDGGFVPNIALGPVTVRAARAATRLPLDVHLMVNEPDRFVEAYAEAGADGITLHVEACTHLQRALARIRALGKRAGVTMNPHTSEDFLRYVLEDVDVILVMTVNPGFGRQQFLPSQLEKLRRVRAMIDSCGAPIDLEVDGGVSPDTARRVVEAGANVLVAGSAVFGKPDRARAIAELRAACE